MGLKPIPAVNQAKKQSLQFEVASEQLNFKIYYMLINYPIAHNGRFFVTFCVPEERRLAQFLQKAFLTSEFRNNSFIAIYTFLLQKL